MRPSRQRLQTTPARRGRPRRDLVERVRAATWARLLVMRMRFSPYRLELLTRGEGRTGRATGIWSKYMAGRASPSSAALQRVDARIKGARDLFEHPLWTLAAKPNLDSLSLRAAIQQLPHSLRNLVLEPLSSERDVFWRRNRLNLNSLNQAAMGAPLMDGLALALALVRDAELAHDQEQHFAATILWAALTARARDAPGYEGLFPDFAARPCRRFLDAPHSSRRIRGLKKSLINTYEKVFLKKKYADIVWLDADIASELRYCSDPVALWTLTALSEARILRQLIG